MNVKPAEEKRESWSLVIFRGLPTREPASIVRDEEQDDLLLFSGSTQESALVKTKQKSAIQEEV